MSLPDRVKIQLTSVNTFLHIFCPKVTQSLLTWASETFNGKLRLNIWLAQWSQWEAYRKPPSLFQKVLGCSLHQLNTCGCQTFSVAGLMTYNALSDQLCDPSVNTTTFTW